MPRALALLALALALPASAADAEPKFRLGRPTDFTTTVLAFSPDGKAVAVTTNRGYTGGMDAPVHIWNCETGKLAHELKYHTVGVMAAAFSPDGKTLATSGIDNKLRFWDAKTGKDITNVKEIALTGHGYNLNFAPDGKRLLVGSTKLELFDVETQQPVKKDYFAETGTSQFFHSASWSPKGKYIAAAADGTAVSLWDAATGALERKIEARLTPGRTRFAFSPDDSLLLVSSWPDGMFKMFDTKTGKEQLAVKPPAGETAPEYLQFARLMGRTARIVQKQGATRELAITDGTGTELKRFEVPAGVASHRLSDTGERLAVGGTNGSLRLYETESGKLERTVIGPWSEVFRAAYADGGKVLRTVHADGSVNDFDADTGAPLKARALKLGTSTFPVTVSADGKLFVTCTDAGAPTVWDLATGEEKAKPKATLFGYREPQFGRGGPFPLPPGGPGGGRAPRPAGAARFPPPPLELEPGPPKFFAAFSADGTLLAAVTGKEEDGVTVFDANTGAEKARVKAPKGAGALAFSADGAHLFVGQSRAAEDGNADPVLVRRYELKKGELVQSWKALPIEKGAGGRAEVAHLLALADGKTLVIAEARVTAANPPPPGAPGRPGRFGETVAHTVRVIDLAGREKDRTVPATRVQLGAFADSKWLAFGELDTGNPNEPRNVVRVVEVATGKVKTIQVGNARFGVVGALPIAFRPNGAEFALATERGEVSAYALK